MDTESVKDDPSLNFSKRGSGSQPDRAALEERSVDSDRDSSGVDPKSAKDRSRGHWTLSTEGRSADVQADLWVSGTQARLWTAYRRRQRQFMILEFGLLLTIGLAAVALWFLFKL